MLILLDRYEDVGENLRHFLMQINIIDVIIKRIGGLNLLITPLGDIEIYEVHMLWETNQVNGLCMA